VSVWTHQGFDGSAIAEKCTDVRMHPVLGKAYRLELEEDAEVATAERVAEERDVATAPKRQVDHAAPASGRSRGNASSSDAGPTGKDIARARALATKILGKLGAIITPLPVLACRGVSQRAGLAHFLVGSVEIHSDARSLSSEVTRLCGVQIARALLPEVSLEQKKAEQLPQVMVSSASAVLDDLIAMESESRKVFKGHLKVLSVTLQDCNDQAFARSCRACGNHEHEGAMAACDAREREGGRGAAREQGRSERWGQGR